MRLKKQDLEIRDLEDDGPNRRAKNAWIYPWIFGLAFSIPAMWCVIKAADVVSKYRRSKKHYMIHRLLFIGHYCLVVRAIYLLTTKVLRQRNLRHAPSPVPCEQLPDHDSCLRPPLIRAHDVIKPQNITPTDTYREQVPPTRACPSCALPGVGYELCARFPGYICVYCK